MDSHEFSIAMALIPPPLAHRLFTKLFLICMCLDTTGYVDRLAFHGNCSVRNSVKSVVADYGGASRHKKVNVALDLVCGLEQDTSGSLPHWSFGQWP